MKPRALLGAGVAALLTLLCGCSGNGPENPLPEPVASQVSELWGKAREDGKQAVQTKTFEIKKLEPYDYTIHGSDGATYKLNTFTVLTPEGLDKPETVFATLKKGQKVEVKATPIFGNDKAFVVSFLEVLR